MEVSARKRSSHIPAVRRCAIANPLYTLLASVAIVNGRRVTGGRPSPVAKRKHARLVFFHHRARSVLNSYTATMGKRCDDGTATMAMRFILEAGLRRASSQVQGRALGGCS